MLRTDGLMHHVFTACIFVRGIRVKPLCCHFEGLFFLANLLLYFEHDRLCGLVVRVPGYRFRGPGSVPGANRFFLISSGPGTGFTQPREDN
jgi:hypothetical protein